MRVIHRGTDLRAFSPQSVDPQRVRRLREAWGLMAHERIVLLAARLTEWKGHKVLIEAARLMTAQGIGDTVFILAGDEQGRTGYVKELDNQIASAGLDGRGQARRPLRGHGSRLSGGVGRLRSVH